MIPAPPSFIDALFLVHPLLYQYRSSSPPHPSTPKPITPDAGPAPAPAGASQPSHASLLAECLGCDVTVMTVLENVRHRQHTSHHFYHRPTGRPSSSAYWSWSTRRCQADGPARNIHGTFSSVCVCPRMSTTHCYCPCCSRSWSARDNGNRHQSEFAASFLVSVLHSVGSQ